MVHGVVDRLGARPRVRGGVAAGPASAGGDRGLDDEVAVGGETRVHLVLGVPGARLQPDGRDHGDSELGQTRKVVLVGVPLHDVRMVGQARHQPGPSQEVGVVALLGVVAHRAQDDDAGIIPVDARVVPYGHPRLDAPLAQGVGQTTVIIVEHGVVGAGRERHNRAGHVSTVPRHEPLTCASAP